MFYACASNIESCCVICMCNIGLAVTVTHSLARVQGSSIIPPHLYVKGDHFSQLPTHRDIMKHTWSNLSQTVGEEEKWVSSLLLEGSHVTGAAVRFNGVFKV